MAKDLVEERRRIDVREVRRDRVIEDGQTECFGFKIEWVPANYGGFVPYWACPVCETRRKVLFERPGGGFGCLGCMDLHYRRQRISKKAAGVARAEAMRARLGWRPGILRGPGDKPKFMQWTTFEKLLEEYVELTEPILGGIRDGLRGKDKRHDHQT